MTAVAWLSSCALAACSGSQDTGNQPQPAASHKQHGADKHGADKHGAHKHGAHKHGAHKHGAHKHGAHKHGAHEHGGDKHGAQGPLGHRFERADEWAPRFDDPGRAAWQQPDKVIQAMAIQAGMTVADIGAGTGYFTPYLSAACGPAGRVLALDIEPDMVRYLKERATQEKLANVDAQQAQVGDPGLAAGSVDRILVVNTWHHIPARAQYAAKLVSALRPGGAVYVVDYRMDSERGPPKDHRLPAATAAEELRAAGLSVEVRADVLPSQYIVIARKRPAA